MIIKPNNEDDIKKLLESNQLILLDFYADWCEPCKWLDIILVEVDTLLDENLLIVKIDIEKIPKMAEAYNIHSVPVLCLIKEKKILWRMNGFLTADQLTKKIKSISRETSIVD